MKGLGRIFKRRFKRSNGAMYEDPAWLIAYSHRGKEYRESSHSESEAVARRLLKKRIGEIGAGRVVGQVEEKVTFDEMAEDLIRDYKTNGRKVSAVDFPIRHLRRSFGFDRALDITTDRARKHVDRRQKEGAANGTINRELAALNRMFSLTVQAGKLSHKPYIPTLEEHNARVGFLDHGSFLALQGNLPSHLKDPVTFLYLAGWRVSEMRSLEWRDIDLAGQVARLRPEVSKNKDGRLLPLKDDLLGIIERAKGKRRLDCPFVFHLKGQAIGDFRKRWQQACCNAGLGKLEDQGEGKRKKYTGTIVHDLRRTAVRNMVRAGVPERVAMSLSGHKTRNVFDRYNIVSEADLAEAVERIHAYLGQQTIKPVVAGIKKIKKG